MLFYASDADFLDLVTVLIENDTDVNRVSDNLIALNVALRCQNFGICRNLILAGSDLNFIAKD